jgi:hypothetical protein
MSDIEITRQYPVGRFNAPESTSDEHRLRLIESIASAPARMRAVATGLSDEELDTPYREGGWTARQVIHHVPESHMNAYIRFKLALTEDEPIVKPYDEAAWAKLPDVHAASIESSLVLLAALHQRWVVLMRGMSEADWQRTYIQPEFGVTRTLDRTLALYAWHGDHHIAHVESVRSAR